MLAKSKKSLSLLSLRFARAAVPRMAEVTGQSFRKDGSSTESRELFAGDTP